MKHQMIGMAVLGGLLAAPAGAVVVAGNTTGGATFNRPVANGALPPVPPPSGVGTAVRYQTTAFTVGTSGSYVFQMSAVSPVNWDTYLGLYSGSFNPALPFANALIYNDDNPTIGLSGFTIALTAGTSYFAVATGFANTDFGTYNLSITGPGTITIGGGGAGVPEPATWALLVGGFGLVGGAMRVRRRNVAFA